jgi:hypothetical protein
MDNQAAADQVYLPPVRRNFHTKSKEWSHACSQQIDNGFILQVEILK